MMPSDKLEQEKEQLQIIQIKQNGCSETTEAGGDGGIWGVCRSKTCSSLRLKRQGEKNVLQIKMQYVQTLLAYYLN